MTKSKELKNIDVHLISLVDKGANKRTVICKSDDKRTDYSLEKLARIAKVDEDKHLVYGVVYAPDDVDAHGDFATAETIEKAAHNFLAKSNTSKAVDTQHNLEPVDGVTIVESAIIKGGHSILSDEPDGTWFIVTKIENEEIWKSVKDGTYTGYSLYGFAERTEEAKSTKNKIVDRLMKWLESEEELAESGVIVKDFNETIAKFKVGMLVDAISRSLYDVMWDDFSSQPDKLAKVLKVLDDAKAYAETIDLAKSLEVSKAGKVISDSNMKKLQAAMDAMQSLMDSAGEAKSKREIINKSIKDNGENIMDPITKEAHEKALADQKAELEAKNAEIQKQLNEANEKLGKSKGSQQVEKEEGKKEEVEVKKGILPFLS